MVDPTIEYRVEQLESKMCEIGADVKLIMRNHLPHIQSKVDLSVEKIDIFKESLDKLSARVIGATVSIIIAIILSALLG